MQSVVIFGAGDLGGALARQIAAADVARRVTLVDEAGQVAEGKALDIRQAAPVDGYSTELFGTADESTVVTANVIVIADRVAGGEWSDDLGVALVRRLRHMNEGALMICAGARQLDVIGRAVREGGLDGRRLLGSAPEALRAAVQSMAALEANCAPSEVSLTVVGMPPGQTIVPWDDASIAGRRASTVLTAPAIARLDNRLPRLWPPGPLTLAGAATRFLSSIAARRPATLSAFVASADAGAPRHRVGMLPVTFDGSGTARVLSLILNVRDRVRLDTALHE